MKTRFIQLLRFSVYSVSAMAVAACARLSGGGDAAATLDPRRSQLPEGYLDEPELRSRLAEDRKMDELENEMQALSVELRTLRSALQYMGPLTDEPYDPEGLVIASGVDMSPSLDVVVARDAPADATFDRAEIYAHPPALNGGHSIFYGVRLADYPTRGAAEADWTRMSSELGLTGLEPRFEDLDGRVRLYAGPFDNRADAGGMCVEMAPVAGVCAPSAFQGVAH